MLEPAELLHTTSTPGPIYSSMTYLTWAASARFYGSHGDLLLHFRSGIWFWSFCCCNISQAAGKVGELRAPGCSDLKRSVCLGLADGDGSRGEGGVMREKAPQALGS